MGTGTGTALIAIGAVLRFAIATPSTHGLNVHVVGIILILAGVLGLLLSLLLWGPMNPARRRSDRSAGYLAEVRPVAPPVTPVAPPTAAPRAADTRRDPYHNAPPL